jgi:hypothetical protein
VDCQLPDEDERGAGAEGRGQQGEPGRQVGDLQAGDDAGEDLGGHHGLGDRDRAQRESDQDHQEEQ